MNEKKKMFETEDEYYDRLFMDIEEANWEQSRVFARLAERGEL